MKPFSYYNEFDPHAAAWLKELIRMKAIPDGEVDQRSITDVEHSDLAGFTQCHFFSGVAGWPLALRIAGWPDDRPVWSGSCPCQPFSDAGKGLGEKDERHLAPQFCGLIRECQPPVVIGEQVASKAALAWLDGVFADLEGSGYACAAADLCAAGYGEDCEIGILRGDSVFWERGIVGFPHIRQRLFWVADSNFVDGYRARPSAGYDCGEQREASGVSCKSVDRLEHAEHARLEGHAGHVPDGGQSGRFGSPQGGSASSTSGGGYFRDFDILPCLDGKSRRIKSGLQPLAHGIPRGVVPSCDPCFPGYAEETGEARTMRLRAYGNAIVPQLAAEFITAYLETRAE